MKRSRLSGGLVVLVICLLFLLGLAVWGFTVAWHMGGSTRMSVHGWIAMGLAAVLTVALGGGLMWLAFYSANHGYDDDQDGRP